MDACAEACLVMESIEMILLFGSIGQNEESLWDLMVKMQMYVSVKLPHEGDNRIE